MIDLFIAAYWLSLNVYHEARNQPEAGQIAIAHVTMNRCIIKGVSVEETVKKPYAFSWLNENDPQKFLPLDLEAFEKAHIAAWKCLKERTQGKDLWGATHYYNPAHANPEWAHMPDEYPLVAVIEDHHFHKGPF